MSGLQGETGQSPDERRAEMERLVEMLGKSVGEMDKWEQGFVVSMQDWLDNPAWVPTPKQLFKARDIKDKY